METAYLQQSLRSANGVELILALYDGAIRFLYRAIQRVEEGDVMGRRAAVKRAIDIILYLQGTLRMDVGGTSTSSLSDFYAVIFTLTLEASHAASKEGFEEAIACLRNVRDAWLMVAKDPEAQKLQPRELRLPEESRAERRAPIMIPGGEMPEPSPARWTA